MSRKITILNYNDFLEQPLCKRKIKGEEKRGERKERKDGEKIKKRREG